MFWLGTVGLAILAWLVLVLLFAPAINYHLRSRTSLRSPRFLRTLDAICQATLRPGNRMEVLTNGENFYPDMLRAISSAQRSINLECYIFTPGVTTETFIEALIERARAGVTVQIVADALGSLYLWGRPFRRLREAGCRVQSYQTLRWYALARLNNRTHRELLVVDGRTAFVGGAGFADWWSVPEDGRPPWRDTMLRVEGPVVGTIQGVFAENWLECCGEILVGDEFFPPLPTEGDTPATVVKSSPADRATDSRVLFQSIIEATEIRLDIQTPYFLPDRPMRRALTEAARRGVAVRVIVPGTITDQQWVRLASRRWYGQLLTAGVRIFEYQPTMMHAKILLADRLWAIVGTTNLDNRSFEHNDEVNLFVLDEQVTARLAEDFERDLADSQEIELADWRDRAFWEKALHPWVWILERQQ